MSATPKTQTASRLLLVLLAVVVLAIAASVAGALAPAGSVDPLATRAEAAGSRGTDPFTADLRPTVETVGSFASSDYTGEVGGNRAGVWRPAEQDCDKATLIDTLTTDANRRQAWTSVLPDSIEDISSYVTGLQSVVLQRDTVVMNHGFVDGNAQPVRTILQAGTLVLVDSDGVPRVLCKCGNPLLTASPIAMEQPLGELWVDFDSKAVISLMPELPPTPVPTTTPPPPTPTPVPSATPVPPIEPTTVPTTTATPVPLPTTTPVPVVVLPTATPAPTPTEVPTPTPEPLPPRVTCRVEPFNVSRDTIFSVTVSWTPADQPLNAVIEIGTTQLPSLVGASPLVSGLQRFDDSPNFAAAISFFATGADNFSTGGPCAYEPSGTELPPETDCPENRQWIEGCCAVPVLFDTGVPVCDPAA